MTSRAGASQSASQSALTAQCHYCHLPIAGGSHTTSDELYCCVGCRLAAQIVGDGAADSLHHALLIRIGFAVFLSMNVMMFTMALWSQELASPAGTAASLESALGDLFRYLCLVLSLPVLWLLGKPLLENAFAMWRQRAIATDLLILIGVAAAFAYSMISVFRGAGHIYFEVGCVVLVMVTLGRWLEATGKLKTTLALDAMERLLPEQVRVVADHDQECFAWQPLATIAPGVLYIVEPGERIALDGVVVSGRSHVDQQALTGESAPLARESGDRVFGGTLNVDGRLTVRVTATADEGVWSRLVQLVRDGRANSGRYQRVSDRVARRFLPAALAIAGMTFSIHTAYSGIESGVLAGLSVLLIACPCALGLAVPMAVSAAFGEALNRQVLFRGGEALERLASVRAVAFDKTGTLTTGMAQVTEVLFAGLAEPQTLLCVASRITAESMHPFAVAIRKYTATLDGGSVNAWNDDVETVPGRGLVVRDARGLAIYLGSVRWMRELHQDIEPRLSAQLERLEQQGAALTALGVDGAVQAIFVLHEQLRPEAAETLRGVKALGCEVMVLTGDHRQRGAALSESLGVSVQAELLPADKLQVIEALREQFGPVAMVGDGLNDAPALAASDLGIAMGCGVDLARESADVCLLGNDLSTVAWAINHSRRTLRVIRQNLFWAFVYNVIGIGLAAGGVLNPGWAALAMVLSSVLVIGNSLRLGAGAKVAPAGTRDAAMADPVANASAPTSLPTLEGVAA